MKNPVFEQALNNEGVTWRYVESVPLSSINETRSRRNQARLEQAIDKDLCSQYEIMYRNKNQFPPLVCYESNKRYVLIDGNQRHQAATDAQLKEHDIYFVECKDQMVLDRLTWRFNNLVNGKRLSPEECLEHAKTFVGKYGMSVKQAAEEWGLPYHRLQRALRVDEVKEIVQRQGVKEGPNLTDDVLYKLGENQKAGEDILGKVATVVVENGLSVKDTDKLNNAVAEAKDHAAKVAAIEEFANSDLAQRRRAETKGGRIKAPRPAPRDVLTKLLKDGAKLTSGNSNPKAFRLPGNEGKAQRKLAVEFTNNLIAIFGLGVPVVEQEETA